MKGINAELTATFRKWYPAFAAANEAMRRRGVVPRPICPRSLMLSSLDAQGHGIRARGAHSR
jgi:hypothetical protein